MTYEIGWDEITCDPSSVVTVGTFDGVHRGHQAIVDYLLRRADKQGGVSTLISFDPHPRAVVHGQDVPLLTTVQERATVLETLGLDRFVVIPFSMDFARLDPVEYVVEILVRRIGLQEIAVGFDHRFGRNREGDIDLLRELGANHDFAVDVIPAQEVNRHVVSSSDIRSRLVEDGDVESAAEMLGRPYAITGAVHRGDGRGRTIGYPTANLVLPDARKLVPRLGVYATQVTLPNGEEKSGMMNVGRRPTFDGMDVTIEVHVLDFEGDLYGSSLTVRFLQRLREERKFDSVDALTTQLSRDERHCRQVIEAFG